MKRPEDLVIDANVIVLSCQDEGEASYVDLRIDTIPLCEGDADYSEDPDILRKMSAWMVRAADWLEKKRGR